MKAALFILGRTGLVIIAVAIGELVDRWCDRRRQPAAADWSNDHPGGVE